MSSRRFRNVYTTRERCNLATGFEGRIIFLFRSKPAARFHFSLVGERNGIPYLIESHVILLYFIQFYLIYLVCLSLHSAAGRGWGRGGKCDKIWPLYSTYPHGEIA